MLPCFQKLKEAKIFKNVDREVFRKLAVHLPFGLTFSLLVYFIPLTLSAAIFFMLLRATILITSGIKEGKRYFIISYVIEKAKRNSEIVGDNVKWYFSAVFMITLLFNTLKLPKNLLVAALLIFAVGDAFATLSGKFFGKRILPRTKTKTWEGMLSGWASSFIISFIFLLTQFDFISSVAFAFFGSLTGALTEAYIGIPDDNFSIPVATASIMAIIYFLITHF